MEKKAHIILTKSSLIRIHTQMCNMALVKKIICPQQCIASQMKYLK